MVDDANNLYISGRNDKLQLLQETEENQSKLIKLGAVSIHQSMNNN